MDYNPNTICLLEFFTGTMATAYKGTITSLVIKDFCIDEDRERLLFKGDILSMPEGDYEIRLISGGKEISRSAIQNGHFQVEAPSRVLAEAKNLQFDVILSGKHIGTFLLKKESAGGHFVSALEISKDLQGIPFKALAGSIGDKGGLLKKGEEIISAVLSTKKDLKKLSNMINSFSQDLYWHSHDAFLLWYPLLVRASSSAAVDPSAKADRRMISNIVSLLELPIERESDEEFLRKVVTIWLTETERANVDVSLRFGNVRALVEEINERFPSINLYPLMKRLLSSVRERARTARSVSDSFVSILSSSLDASSVSQLVLMSESGRASIRETVMEAEERVKERSPIGEISEQVRSVNISSLDDNEMIETVFHAIIRNLDAISEPSFESLLPELGRLLSNIDEDSSATTTALLRDLIKHLLIKGRGKGIRTMFTMLTDSGKKDEIILNRQMAELILGSADTGLLESYRELLLSIPIPAPGISGFSDETWAERVNPLHLKRLTGFMDVVSADPKAFREIVIHTVCNLFIHKAFIPDDRLFQRNISAYLNAVSDTGDVLLHYSLLKRLPVYYNDVGASGKIRDLSTEIDSWGDDPAIYFLRKQVHVNASSNNVSLIEGMLNAWARNTSAGLRGLVPNDIIASVNTDLLSDYSAVVEPLLRKLGVTHNGRTSYRKLIDLSDEIIEQTVAGMEGSEEAKGKALLLCRIYREIVRKYSLLSRDPEEQNDPFDALAHLTRELGPLYETAFSPEKTEAQESFYFKRHIAFGIPSVIGTYHERKFDALASIFRTEESIRLSIERIIERVDSSTGAMNRDEWQRWLRALEAVMQLFALHGTGNARINSHLRIAKENALRSSQAADILRIMQNELTWIVELFYRTFHRPLMKALALFSPGELPDFFTRRDPSEQHFLDRVSDTIIRDMINSVAGFEELDRLLNSMIRLLSLSVETGGDQEFPPEKATLVEDKWFVIGELVRASLPRLYPLLGTKAGNLAALMARDIPVPLGVVFSAARTEDYEIYTRSAEFGHDLKEALEEIEKRSGWIFGHAKDPLFLSVRSGSLISMPGILSSILYCGMNDDTFKGFLDRTGNEWLCLDSRRRFIEHYATVVLDLDSRHFDIIQKMVLRERNASELHHIDEEGLRRIIKEYNVFMQTKGLLIPDDPFSQLRESVRAIYRSWFHEKAMNYRRAMNVSPYWGTSVTLMEMKTVNTAGSGASVFLTRNPHTLERMVYGEAREKGTGDDIVYGRLNNLPLSAVQTDDRPSLEETNPSLYAAHQELARRIEDAMGGLPQEVESAYQTDGNTIQIWALQTRRMEFRKSGRERVKDLCMFESNVIGRGLGVHGGALNGVVTFETDTEKIRRVREEAELPVILLRKETSTDDVALMSEVNGIITSAGGVTSHAAVLAQKFNLTAIVSCTDLVIDLSDPHSPRARIGEYEISEGSPLSMDGSTGLIYSGVCMLPV